MIADFRRKTQESVIQAFNQLDKYEFTIARSRIRSKLINGLPSLDHFTSGVDESAAAMLRVLSKCVGPTRTALIDETTRALGFNRRGANIARAMNEAFDLLVNQNQITECNGKIVRK